MKQKRERDDKLIIETLSFLLFSSHIVVNLFRRERNFISTLFHLCIYIRESCGIASSQCIFYLERLLESEKKQQQHIFVLTLINILYFLIRKKYLLLEAN